MANKIFNNTMRKALVVFLILSMIIGFSTSTAMAVEAAKPEQVKIPVSKTWVDDNQDGRPGNIQLDLYRYSGNEFVLEDAEKIGETTLTASDNWEGFFEVTKADLLDEQGKTYKLEMIEAEVEGYKTTECSSPQVSLETIALTVEKDWTKVTPCNSLTLKNIVGKETTLVMKKGHDFVVWTSGKLTKAETEIIIASVRANFNEANKIASDNTTFINGDGATAKGMSVNGSTVSFEKKSDWSLIGLGAYTEEYEKLVVKSDASVTNTQLTEEPGQPGDENPGQPGDENPGQPGDENPGQPGDENPGQPGEDEPVIEEPGQPDTFEPGIPPRKPLPEDRFLILEDESDFDEDVETSAVDKNSPNTGDYAAQNLLLYVIILAISAVAVLVLYKGKSKVE